MADPLTTVLLTGISGAGKTVALRALEDIGFYCVDNLPLPMIRDFVATMKKEPRVNRVAMVVDARFQQYLRGYSEAPAALTFDGDELDILYLDAADDVLIRRFSQTRRRHPVAETDLPQALATERELLAPLRAQATTCIDTTELNTHQLKQIIQDRYQTEEHRPRITFVSFGFRYGLPSHADLVLDVRFLPNPFFVPSLKRLTGQDPAVQAFVLQPPDTVEFLDRLEGLFNFLLPRYHAERKAYITIAIGCTGGQHRSVAVAEALKQRLATHAAVNVQHRDVERAVAEGV